MHHDLDVQYPYGTIWRCGECGSGWQVGNGHTSLWLSWDRRRKYDAPHRMSRLRRWWRQRHPHQFGGIGS
jgi:hypothetical protein